jgi:hypothetical protein
MEPCLHSPIRFYVVVFGQRVGLPFFRYGSESLTFTPHTPQKKGLEEGYETRSPPVHFIRLCH